MRTNVAPNRLDDPRLRLRIPPPPPPRDEEGPDDRFERESFDRRLDRFSLMTSSSALSKVEAISVYLSKKSNNV